MMTSNAPSATKLCPFPPAPRPAPIPYPVLAGPTNVVIKGMGDALQSVARGG